MNEVWIWVIGGMIQTGENWNVRWVTCPTATLSMTFYIHWSRRVPGQWLLTVVVVVSAWSAYNELIVLVISLVICKTTDYVLMNLAVRTCPKSCLQYLVFICMSPPLLIQLLKCKLNLYQFSESDSLCINLCLTKYGAHYILQL